MRYLLLTILLDFSLVLWEFEGVEEANAWQPCMPFCDTMCTGVASLEMSANFASSHSSISSALIENNNKITTLSENSLNALSSIYSQESLNSQDRIRAWDGLSKKVVIALERLGIESEKVTDHLIESLSRLKREMAIVNQVKENSRYEEINEIIFINNKVASTPEISDLIIEAQKLSQEHSVAQSSMGLTLSNQSDNQISGLLKELSYEVKNPLTNPDLDSELLTEYRKGLFLLFNAETKHPDQYTKKLIQSERDIILAVIGKFISENIAVNETSDAFINITGSDSATVEKLMFDNYKELLLQVDEQTQIKLSRYETLLVIHNLQLAQRNIMLNEFRKIKSIKTALLALSS